MTDLYSYEEALRALLTVVPSPETEEVPLEECRGRVLAEEISADIPIPPFDRSAMDGYAVHSADCVNSPLRLEVIATVAAGIEQLPVVKRGQAAQTRPGAPVRTRCGAARTAARP